MQQVRKGDEFQRQVEILKGQLESKSQENEMKEAKLSDLNKDISDLSQQCQDVR